MSASDVEPAAVVHPQQYYAITTAFTTVRLHPLGGGYCYDRAHVAKTVARVRSLRWVFSSVSSATNGGALPITALRLGLRLRHGGAIVLDIPRIVSPARTDWLPRTSTARTYPDRCELIGVRSPST